MRGLAWSIPAGRAAPPEVPVALSPRRSLILPGPDRGSRPRSGHCPRFVPHYQGWKTFRLNTTTIQAWIAGKQRGNQGAHSIFLKWRNSSTTSAAVPRVLKKRIRLGLLDEIGKKISQNTFVCNAFFGSGGWKRLPLKGGFRKKVEYSPVKFDGTADFVVT